MPEPCDKSFGPALCYGENNPISVDIRYKLKLQFKLKLMLIASFGFCMTI